MHMCCVHLCLRKGLQRSQIVWGSFTQRCSSQPFTFFSFLFFNKTAVFHLNIWTCTWSTRIAACDVYTACVVIAEREQGVEKAHIKTSTVYPRSQVLFGFKKNNKQMHIYSMFLTFELQRPEKRQRAQWCQVIGQIKLYAKPTCEIKSIMQRYQQQKRHPIRYYTGGKADNEWS